MQTWITDYNFYDSAFNLDTKRLGSQIYEAIHILASLLNCTDKLVNPKRNVKNHPAAKLWVEYEQALINYIFKHINVWYTKNGIKENSINLINFKFICNKAGSLAKKTYKTPIPKWITNELINTHRSVLIQKEIEKEDKLYYKIRNLKHFDCKNYKEYAFKTAKFVEQIKNNNHYRHLWPDCPKDLKMRYDFRGNNY